VPKENRGGDIKDHGYNQESTDDGQTITKIIINMYQGGDYLSHDLSPIRNPIYRDKAEGDIKNPFIPFSNPTSSLTVFI
jgi:hypothetical protein